MRNSLGPGDDALSRIRGTGPWISRKLMPTSKPKLQSAAKVTTPASAHSVALALVEQHDVLLDLAGDVAERLAGQGRVVAVHEVLRDAETRFRHRQPRRRAR